MNIALEEIWVNTLLQIKMIPNLSWDFRDSTWSAMQNTITLIVLSHYCYMKINTCTPSLRLSVWFGFHFFNLITNWFKVWELLKPKSKHLSWKVDQTEPKLSIWFGFVVLSVPCTPLGVVFLPTWLCCHPCMPATSFPGFVNSFLLFALLKD